LKFLKICENSILRAPSIKILLILFRYFSSERYCVVPAASSDYMQNRRCLQLEKNAVKLCKQSVYLTRKRPFSCEGPYLTSHISVVNRVIPVVLQRSIVVQNVYRKAKNRGSKSESAATTEGQTCGIARFRHLSEKKLSPHGPLERRNGCR